MWTDVPAADVIAYLQRLADDGLYPNSVSARPAYLADYVRRCNVQGGLVKWTVVLKSNSQAKSDRRWTVDPAIQDVGLAKRTDQLVPGRYTIKSLIGSADENIDLTRDQKEAARIASGGGGDATGVWLRRQRPHTNGLLILYLLDPGPMADGSGGPPSGPPFAAYCLSLPTDPNNTAVDYVTNTVFARDMLGT